MLITGHDPVFEKGRINLQNHAGGFMRVRLPGLLSLFASVSIVVASGHTVRAGEIKITEMAVTTKIVKGNPIDSVSRISSSSVKALFCFTRLTKDLEEDASVKHVWYKNNQFAAEYDLPVKGKRWRTYSRKLIGKGASGDWRVEVLDEEGNLLKSINFRIN